MSNDLIPCGYCHQTPGRFKYYCDEVETNYVECTNQKCSHKPTTGEYTDMSTAEDAWNSSDIICKIKHPIEVRKS